MLMGMLEGDLSGLADNFGIIGHNIQVHVLQAGQGVVDMSPIELSAFP